MKKIFAILSALVIFISSCKTPEPPSGETETTASANSVTAASARTQTVEEAEPTSKIELKKYSPIVLSGNIDITDKITNANFRSVVRRRLNMAANAPIMSDDAARITELYISDCGLDDLAGIEYFTELELLDCADNNLKVLPPLPDSVTRLYCYENEIGELPVLPKSLERFDCDDNYITFLPDLPEGLIYLSCNENQLEDLPKLPQSLEQLYCNNNFIWKMPEINENLKRLYIEDNYLTKTPVLPDSLMLFSCVGNPITNASAYTRNEEYAKSLTEEKPSVPLTPEFAPAPAPETPPAPKPEPVPFPTIDGSTSTIALDVYLRQKIRGIDYPEADRQTKHNKTFEAFENLVNDKADIVLSVPLAKEQEAYAAENDFEYEAVPVAMEGFVFLVNPKNPVQSLTQEQVRDIYSGKITNWKELGGNDAPIEAYQRNSDSGSQTYMVDFMGETALTDAPETMVQFDMGGVISLFADYDNSINAIGYSVYSYAAVFAANEGTFNFVEIDGVKPSRTTFIDGTYPLLSETYAFYKKDTIDKVVKDYIELITSEKGQQYVLEAGYIPVMDIEIPAAYTLYEAKGTGAIAPENINSDYYELDIVNYEYDTRPRGFLKDTAFEAEIQAWIDEAEDYYENMPKTDWINEYYTCQYYARIQNGYLGISVGLEYCEGVGAFEEFYGQSAVFDIVNKKRIYSLSDMFYKDTDFMPEINKGISAEIMSKTYGGTMVDFFGLCSDFTFDLYNINLRHDNAYFDFPPSFRMNFLRTENSVVSQCRDFTEYITPEFQDKIEFNEYNVNTMPIETYYEKNDHIYSYFEYQSVENDRELPENKLIEEMYDKYYADGGYDYGNQNVVKSGVFFRLDTGFEMPTYYYSTIEHKFLELEDFFKDGFIEKLELDSDRYSKADPYMTVQEIFKTTYYPDSSYESSNTREWAVWEIVKQLSDEYKDDYIVITAIDTPDLRVDAEWLKDVYRDLPLNE
jgi:phosphate transport system substrate-binding protein